MIRRDEFADVLAELLTVYDIELRPGRAELYYSDLSRFSHSVVRQAAVELRQSSVRFPTVAAWIERCRAIAAQRAARSAKARCETAGPSAPMTWETTAHIVLTYAAFAGVKAGDQTTRERALGIIHDELRAGLREEFNGPMDVPRARRIDERKRIVRLLVQEFACDGESEASTRECRS